MKKLFCFGLLLAASFPSALAYIDPGTGAVLLSTIWPFIVAFFSAIFAFVIKWFWNPIKRFFGGIKRIFVRNQD